MSVLSRVFEKLFLTSEEIQLKRSFEKAVQALSANDTPVLKAALANTTFGRSEKQSLLTKAIAVDNLEGFETILKETGTDVSQSLHFSKHIPFVYEIHDTPMLPYAIGLGSTKIACYLASHPDTNLRAFSKTAFIGHGCATKGGFYASEPPSVIDVQSAAQSAGMDEVAGIIASRLNGAPKSPSNH